MNPWIWLQDTEDYGKADCGCELFQSHEGSGAAVLLCPLHDAAPALLAALARLLDESQGPDWDYFLCSGQVEHVLIQARAAIAKAKGGTACGA